MSKVDEAISEITSALTDIAPKHEGLRDFSRLNLHPDTMQAVQAAIGQYDRRVALLQDAKEKLVNLRNDGYPELDIPEVTEAVLTDLKENEATIEAALKQFHPETASTLGLSSGAPVPKP